MNKKLFLLFFMLIIVITHVICQTLQNDSIKQIEEVVVTGTLKETNKKFLPYNVSVISKEEIFKSTTTSALELISENVPGIFITQRSNMGFGGAQGSAGTITSRGLGGFPTTQVLMLIDGHPQFMGIMGHHLPDAFSVLNVDRIEVLRGPASLLYGSNALGGVINIITKKPYKDEFDGTAQVLTGYYGTYSFLNSNTWKLNKLYIVAATGFSSTDGYRSNSSFNASNGYLKIGYDVNKNLSFVSDVYLTKYKASDPGPDTINANPGIVADIFRGYWSASLKNNFEKMSGETRFYHNFGEHFLSDGFHSKDFHLGVQIFETVNLWKNSSITIGSDFSKFGGFAERTVNIDTSLYDFGLFLLYNQKIFNKFSFNIGIRRQDHQYAGINYIPALGFTYFDNEAFSAKFNLSKGFRNPTLREIFLVSHINDLKPENVIGYDLSFNYKIKKINSEIEMSMFYISGNDILIRIPNIGLVNEGKIENKGVELSINIKPIEYIQGNFIYTYINMKEPVYATPEHNLILKLSYIKNHIKASSIIRYINNMDNDPTNKINKVNFFTMDLNFAYNIFSKVSLLLNFNNITNNRYEIIRYYPMPEFNIDGGIKIYY